MGGGDITKVVFLFKNGMSMNLQPRKAGFHCAVAMRCDG